MEVETFALLLQSREDSEDGALDPTISKINEIKNELLKNSKNIEIKIWAPNILVIDRILELLERAKQ